MMMMMMKRYVDEQSTRVRDGPSAPGCEERHRPSRSGSGNELIDRRTLELGPFVYRVSLRLHLVRLFPHSIPAGGCSAVAAGCSARR